MEGERSHPGDPIGRAVEEISSGPRGQPPLMEAAATFPARLESATEARRFAERTLASWECPGLTDTVALLVSELVVNTVSHADSAATLRLVLDDRVLRVEVDDSSQVLPSPQVTTADDSSGRGLMIVEALADRWGVEPTVSGKAVWFELDGGGLGSS